MNYDTNLKVYPPLRTKSAVNELRKAVVDGTVDCIASHHMPHEYDSKEVEFEYAKYGMISLETCYAVLKTALPDVDDARWVEMLSVNPRKIFGLQPLSIESGNAGVLTLFSATQKTVINQQILKSRSRNSPFMNQALNGRVIGIVNQDKVFLN
jgi:dihydroorotase